jgi:hypothetical protein
MPLSIHTSNSPNLTLYAVVDKVSVVGVKLSPAIRWNNAEAEFVEESTITVEDALIELFEDSDIPGLYYNSHADINGAAENLRITILDDSFEALGTSLSIPIEAVNPEVIIDLNVTETR